MEKNLYKEFFHLKNLQKLKKLFRGDDHHIVDLADIKKNKRIQKVKYKKENYFNFGNSQY